MERFERLELVGKDLTKVKNEIVKQFVLDRKGMREAREQARTAKTEIKEELKNMKVVMSSLFEIQKQVLKSL